MQYNAHNRCEYQNKERMKIQTETQEKPEAAEVHGVPDKPVGPGSNEFPWGIEGSCRASSSHNKHDQTDQCQNPSGDHQDGEEVQGR